MTKLIAVLSALFLLNSLGLAYIANRDLGSSVIEIPADTDTDVEADEPYDDPYDELYQDDVPAVNDADDAPIEAAPADDAFPDDVPVEDATR